MSREGEKKMGIEEMSRAEQAVRITMLVLQGCSGATMQHLEQFFREEETVLREKSDATARALLAQGQMVCEICGDIVAVTCLYEPGVSAYCERCHDW